MMPFFSQADEDEKKLHPRRADDVCLGRKIFHLVAKHCHRPGKMTSLAEVNKLHAEARSVARKMLRILVDQILSLRLDQVVFTQVPHRVTLMLKC